MYISLRRACFDTAAGYIILMAVIAAETINYKGLRDICISGLFVVPLRCTRCHKCVSEKFREKIKRFSLKRYTIVEGLLI